MKLNSYNLFSLNKNTLKEVSKDDSNPEKVEYLTYSTQLVVDFDKVKRKYCNALNCSEDNACSVDAVSETTDGISFIEFKNGRVNNRNVKDKIRDSLLMFCDITKETISFTQKNAELIVVYNETNNPLPNQYTKHCVQQVPSRTFISKKIAQMGGEEIILFDLGRYKDLYFKEVHTYSQEEFEDYQKKICSL